MLLSSLLTAAIPFVVGNVFLLLSLRIASGLAQGTLGPCIYMMLSKWVPKTEKSIAYEIVFQIISCVDSLVRVA